MKVFICIDEKSGMMFNGRRQSKDRILNERVLEIVENDTLYVTSYTQTLFPQGIVCDDFLNKEGYAFIEDPKQLDGIEIDALYVFCWNRRYPSDAKCDIDWNDFSKIYEEDFAGYSHEKITLSLYVRND